MIQLRISYEYAECIYESGTIKIEFVTILDNSRDFSSR